MIDLSIAITASASFFVCIILSILSDYFIGITISLFILAVSVFMYYCYFRGYSFPKTKYLQQINDMCTPPTRHYIFKETQFEVNTEQSTRTIFYSHIKQMIDTENLIILIGSYQEIVISKKCIPDNCNDLIDMIRMTSHCIYSKLDQRIL